MDEVVRIIQKASNETTTEEICLTPCVIVDFIKSKVQPCNSIKKLRLEQMVGTWEIGGSVVDDINNYNNLGVCFSHFLFDQNQLHNK